eukprot:1154522-Prymnesium_polylepis.1
MRLHLSVHLDWFWQPERRSDRARLLGSDRLPLQAVAQLPSDFPIDAPSHPHAKVGVLAIATDLDLAIAVPERPHAVPQRILVLPFEGIAIGEAVGPVTMRPVAQPVTVVHATVGIAVHALALHPALDELAQVGITVGKADRPLAMLAAV